VINLGEVYYIVGRSKGIPEADSVIEDLEQLSLKVIPADRSAVLRAASLTAVHRLSYADAFAMAAALALDATLMTGNPELIALAEHVRVEALLACKDNRCRRTGTREKHILRKHQMIGIGTWR
jgi:predicted nucleic acid-binding protein